MSPLYFSMRVLQESISMVSNCKNAFFPSFVRFPREVPMWKSMCCGLLAVLAIAGCGGGGGGGNSVAVSISPTVSVLPVGGTQTFVAAGGGAPKFWAAMGGVRGSSGKDNQ